LAGSASERRFYGCKFKIRTTKKLEVKETFGDTFKFDNPGDQIVFKFLQRKTIEKTKLGKPGDVVECEILAGEKVDKTTKQISEVKPGPGSFFLGTHLRELFDKDAPLKGDICHVQFVKIGNSNFHLFGFEILERAK